MQHLAVENTTMARDDFSPAVKELLAKRVGYRCSNPYCRQPTSGPQVDPAKVINVGVAAHITAASAGGARYDGSLSQEQRADSSNGLWLCQKCAKLVDNDEVRYTIQGLQKWKSAAEELALSELEGKPLLSQPGIAIASQLDALQGSVIADLHRMKRADYSRRIPELVESLLGTLQGIRWTNPDYFLIPASARSQFENAIKHLDEDRHRNPESVWYSMFTVLNFLRLASAAIRENNGST